MIILSTTGCATNPELYQPIKHNMHGELTTPPCVYDGGVSRFDAYQGYQTEQR